LIRLNAPRLGGANLRRMAPSRTIAAILGPALAALAVSEGLNLGIWAQSEPQVVYLNGTLLLVAGLAILRAHNVWTWRWPVLVTAAGWVACAAGLYRMFAPSGPQAHEGAATYGMLSLLALVGVVLSYFGWRPSR